MNEIVGIFVKELKNRFLCEVIVDGVSQECYIASSCHLGNFIDLSGKEVILRKITSTKARTKYAVKAFIVKKHEIPLEMAISNRVIENEINRRLFSFLGSRKRILRESTIGDYKCDLCIQDTNTLIEIKSVLTLDKHAFFPTVYSERAVQQLVAIEKLLLEGYKVFYFLVSLNPCVVDISINSKSVEFVNAFKKCVDLGMEYCGFAIETYSGQSSIRKKIPVKIE